MSRGAATVLERILAQTREEVERRKREQPLERGSSPAAAHASAGSAQLPRRAATAPASA